MATNLSFLTEKSIIAGRSPVVRFAGYLVLAFAVSACSPEATEQELLDRARLAMERGDARAAEIDAKTALQENPDNANARRMVGESYMFQQNAVAAVDEFERALSVADDDEVRVLYARAMLSSGRGERLLELDGEGDFDSVGENPRYLATLARARAAAGELQRARDLMDTALASAPDDPFVTTSQALFLLVYSQAPEEARGVLQDTVSSHPEYADAWGLLAGIQQMSGELAEAETSYEKAVELNAYRFQDRLSLVAVRLDQGKTDAAEVDLQRMLANNPDHPGVNFLWASMLVESGDNAEALAALFKVLNDQPDHGGALYLSAVANIAEGNLATAQSQLNRLLSRHPGHLMGQLLLSNLHLRMGDPAAAGEVARGLLQYDDMNYPAMALLATALRAQGENGAESIELYERMATARPEAVEPRLALGAALLQAGDDATGIAQFHAARDLAPESAEVWERLIQAQLARGETAAARAEAEAYAEQQPRNPRPRIFLARIAQQENDIAGARVYFSEAEEQLREALAAQPENMMLSGLLLNALMGQGKLEEADTVLAGLPEEAARQPAVLVARGRLALAGNRLADAESFLRSAMNEDPGSMTLLWLTGAIDAQGREEEAIELLNDWLADNPADAMVRNELASSYLQLGREREAAEHYQEVVESAPDNVIVLNNLAWLLRKDDPEQALAYIERASELMPENPQIMDTHAMIQLELGATGEALALNRKALDMTPDNPETRYHRAMILRADGQREQAIRILQELVDAGDSTGDQSEDARILLAELQGR